MLYTSHGQPMPGTPVDPDIISYISSECSGVYSCLQCQAEIRKNFNVDHPNYKKFWDAQIRPVIPMVEVPEVEKKRVPLFIDGPVYKEVGWVEVDKDGTVIGDIVFTDPDFLKYKLKEGDE